MTASAFPFTVTRTISCVRECSEHSTKIARSRHRDRIYCHDRVYVDLGSMTPQERLGTLCAAAERHGVIK